MLTSVNVETMDELLRETLAEPTIARAFLRSATGNRERVALRQFGTGAALTYGDWLERSRRLAGGLQALGVQRGDRIAVLLSSRLEFHVIDIGACLLGVASFSLYNTAPVEQLLDNVDNAEPTVLVSEAQYADRARELVRLRPSLRLVMVDGAAEGELSLADLEASCPDGFDLEAAVDAVEPGDLLTLVYTSGTTGSPKGVQYVQGGLMYAVSAYWDRLRPSPHGRCISYLPMAHIAERQIHYYAGLAYGLEITVLPDPRRLQDALLEVRPTWFFGVPRVYEKLEVTMLADIDPATQRALDAAVERVRAGESPQEDAALLAPLAEATGLERAEWIGVSGAPCDRALMERFHAVGLPIGELWGLSESVIGTGSRSDRIRLGTAGEPYKGTEIRLGDDGEIFIRSPSVTPGYLKEPERTRDAFTQDGWLKTGDLGRFDDDGYLSIVGRKKDIIINSAGKNMSPANIEAAIRGTESLIQNVVCFGDGRPYNVGLIVLDPQASAEFAAAHDLPPVTVAELARHPVLIEHLNEVVADGNARLSRVEQLKRFAVVEGEWLPGGDELTLTNKVKRAAVNEKYADQVDALYAAGRTRRS
jgi:long-subunit acyl-CoA synthetase (AMP-forming)